LPDAFGLPNVKGQVDGSNVRITFDPQADARDYRVYVLPKKEQIVEGGVRDAVYRCAGESSVPRVPQDDEMTEKVPGVKTRVVGKVGPYTRTLEDATLGYVFTTPAEDRLPVYALGDPDLKADNITCYEQRWPESRVKIYTTSEAERADLLAKRWRDDGIVFYVPKPDTAGTETVFQTRDKPGDFASTNYMKAGSEYDRRTTDGGATGSEAFAVYSAMQDGAEPLMRVAYGLTCGHGHDELVAGVARFNRAYAQGAQPVTALNFAGITEETTLVVEALDALCPFQGTLAPMSRPARSDPFEGFTIEYPAFQTPAELSATSPIGELFINGQGDATTPRAISRACLKVKPEAVEGDFVYDGSVETFSEPKPRNFQIWEMESPTFDVQFFAVATDQWSIGSMFGELWATYADWAADTNGKLRITPKARGTFASDKFLHASMSVDMVSTQRRYPQLLLSTLEPPIQDNLVNGTTIVIQTFGGITTPVAVQIQFCDHRHWDVNDQCPSYDLTTLKRGDESFLSPRPEINGWMAVDEVVRFDAFVSTGRVYLFTNGQPYACADLPNGKLPAGKASVTYGDVLYHSSVDLEAWYPFHLKKMHELTTRHFSDLAFTSGVAAPAWDENRFPCASVETLK
jgi:Repeat of unknown function (DUF5648)